MVFRARGANFDDHLNRLLAEALLDAIPTKLNAAPERLNVGLTGLEPATFRPPAGRATKLRHSPLAAGGTLSHGAFAPGSVIAYT